MKNQHSILQLLVLNVGILFSVTSQSLLPTIILATFFTFSSALVDQNKIPFSISYICGRQRFRRFLRFVLVALFVCLWHIYAGVLDFTEGTSLRTTWKKGSF